MWDADTQIILNIQIEITLKLKSLNLKLKTYRTKIKTGNLKIKT